MFPYAAREFRHNPCLMGPLTFVGALLLCVFWTVAFLWKAPLFLLGYLMNPIINRTQFIIEFLYPLGMGRWIHLMICRLVSKNGGGGNKGGKSASDKNRGHHSRSVETRIEVIPGRLYIHPLPQLLDNLGYLVVSCPTQKEVAILDSTPLAEVSAVTLQHIDPPQIVAFVVDCGDATAVLKQIELISETHYQKKKIHVQAILSTHKHHDHTAGNVSFKNHRTTQDDMKIIVGGAVEKVPGCNFSVADGDMIPLPKHGNNDMADFVEVEAVATPAHTRGSIAYVLRLKPEHVTSANSAYGFLFTGDTMFSAGGGVPFEADVDPNQEQKEAKKSFTSIVKASASLYAVERCFGEILARFWTSSSAFPTDLANRTLVMPGHEYTHELLSRQLMAGTIAENCRWKNFAPNVFFDTVSALYTTLHRRSLPHSSGKIISAMGSPISVEMSINPYFRNMRKRGEIIIQAVQFWHKQFARGRIPDHLPSAYYCHFANASSKEGHSRSFAKSVSNESQWTLDASDLGRPIFTTVYAADLDQVIRDLDHGTISAAEGARRLSNLKDRLKENPMSRRPVPATLPSDRAVYRGLLALALLGSSPTALTLKDSDEMNLPKPVVKSSDELKISKSHLISVLQWVGLLTGENNGPRIIAMIHQLWKEAKEDSPNSGNQTDDKANLDTVDPESDQNDLVDLGDLKWSLYGVPRQQSGSTFCLPCSKPRRMDPDHPVHSSGMKPHSGEIVRHDVYHCAVCQTRTGCAYLPADNNEDNSTLHKEPLPETDTRPVVARIGSTDNDEDGMFVEVSSMPKEIPGME